MPTFDFTPLFWWGLPVAAAPLLIHLVNLLRHRRVPWAAMEFLLASQRIYRTRVLLRQLLLLALRTAAILGLVLVCAQPRWRHALGGLFGAGGLHTVLIDDSYSMGERQADGRSGFDLARTVVERIAADLAADRGGQELIVATSSSLAAADERSARALLVERQGVSPGSLQGVRDRLAAARVSAGDRGPREALPALAAALRDTAGVRVLWVVSDFRGADWGDAGLAGTLRDLSAAGVEIRLVDCAAGRAAGATNLTIERLEAAGGVPAAGVLVPCEVAVRNDGPQAVRGVQLELREDDAARPGVRFEEIAAGATATRRFDVRFAAAGGHVVEARLPADVLPADDVRRTVIEVAEQVDVLVIDPDPRGADAFHVATALAPGAGAPTGLRPRIERPAALGTLDLTAFGSVWLLDVERLEPAESTALEEYARRGGGVVFFAGPRTRADVVNRTLHRGGEGLYPVALAGPVDLPRAPAGPAAPDLVAEEHPVVAVLAGQRNPLLDTVHVDRVMAVERGQAVAGAAADATGVGPDARGPDAPSAPRRLLSLRTGAPLAVERPFGAGLAVAVLTTAAPTWNDWARGNPSWVVVLLELEAHVARARRRTAAVEVGADVIVPLAAGSDETEVDFLVPPDGTLVRQRAETTPTGPEARLPAVAVPGSYVARWRRFDGSERERTVAVNVAPSEGRLERFDRARLDAALAGVRYRLERADDLGAEATSLAGTPLVRPLLAALLVVLVVEQLVACAAGYHAAPRRSPAA